MTAHATAPTSATAPHTTTDRPLLRMTPPLSDDPCGGDTRRTRVRFGRFGASCATVALMLSEDGGRAGALVDAAFWRGRRVLVTGHTGFKGAWLSLWLE